MGLQDWIETGVAVGTLLLAGVTGFMAWETRRLAQGSEQQLDLLRRQTVAAEAVKDQGERKLVAENAPVLNVLRADGEEVAGGRMEGDFWLVTLRNDGPVPATITEAKLNQAPQPVFLTAGPSGAIAPEKLVVLRGTIPEPLYGEMCAGRVPAELSVTYESPGGHRQNTRATIRAKNGGDRWLVIEREKHKAA